MDPRSSPRMDMEEGLRLIGTWCGRQPPELRRRGIQLRISLRRVTVAHHVVARISSLSLQRIFLKTGSPFSVRCSIAWPAAKGSGAEALGVGATACGDPSSQGRRLGNFPAFAFALAFSLPERLRVWTAISGLSSPSASSRSGGRRPRHAFGLLTTTSLLTLLRAHRHGSAMTHVTEGVHDRRLRPVAHLSPQHRLEARRPAGAGGHGGRCDRRLGPVNIDGKVIEPYVSAYLVLVGFYICSRPSAPWRSARVRDWLVPFIGLAGGGRDAAGGGGWGPIVTTSS